MWSGDGEHNSKNGPDSLCTVVQISVRLGLVGCCHVRAQDIEFGRLCIYIAANASSDVVKRCLSFISTLFPAAARVGGRRRPAAAQRPPDFCRARREFRARRRCLVVLCV